MVDIPAATTAWTGTALPRASAGQAVAEIAVTLLQAPDKVAAATRVIEASGLLASAPNASGITLATALGTLELTLAELVGKREQQQILDLLTSLYQRRAVVTLMIAPGSPPEQQPKATLLLPPERPQQALLQASTPRISQDGQPFPETTGANVTTTTTSATATTTAAAASSSPASVATRLRAIVLPAATASPAWPSVFTNTQAPGQSLQPQSANAQPATAPLSPASASSLPPQPAIPAQNAAAAFQSYDKAMRNALNALQEVQNAALKDTPTATPEIITATASRQTASPAPPAPQLQYQSQYQSQSQSQSQSQTQFSPTSLQLQPPAPAPSLTTGQEVFLRIAPASATQANVPPAPVAPPNQTADFPSQPTAATTQEWQTIATVEAKGCDGQAILRSPGATFFVAASHASPLAKAPIGSQWSIALAQQPSSFPEPAIPQTDTLAAQPDSDSLAALLNALTEEAPATATPGLACLRPQLATDHQLGTGLLFFLSALKGNSWQNWQGENAPPNLFIRARQSQLMDRLKQALHKTAHDEESANGDLWRACNLPWSEHDSINASASYPQLYVRKNDHENRRDHNDNDPRNAGSRNARFLIDMRLSRLGAIQLDGLVGTKKMDLILRSETPLPETVLNELKPLYENTLSAFGYAGLLQFQTGRSRWITFKKSSAHPLIVT